MTAKTPKIYDICDVATEGIIYFMMIFSPWAFGTTDPLSITVMNIAGYLLGLLLLTKWITCRVTGYVAHRWESDASPRWQRFQRLSTRALAGITIFLLAYVLCQAVNARADYLWGYGRFEYFDYIKWLPSSFDQGATWQGLFKWSALACVFWSVRDWFTVKSIHERRKFRKDENRERVQPLLNRKITRFLWVLSINAGLLALVGILQRFSGTDKLLWLVQPPINKSNIQQFGPWAYRGMAAAWFNMVWPLTVGFLLLKLLNKGHSKEHGKNESFFVLVPLTVIVMIAPALSSSRLGLLVSALVMLLFALRFGATLIRQAGRYKWATVSAAMTLLVGGGWMVVEQVWDRLSRSSIPPVATGNNAADVFRITAELNMPTDYEDNWKLMPIFSLSSSDSARRTQGSFEAFLNRKGDLIISSSGEIAEDRLIWRYAGYAIDHAGKKSTLELHARAGEKPALLVDGTLVELTAARASSTAVLGRVSSRYLWTAVGRSPAWRDGPLESVRAEFGLLDGKQPESGQVLSVDLTVPPVSRVTDSSGREEIYDIAKQMIRDYPVYGIGMAVFPALSQMYKPDGNALWHAYVHNDWLELAVTLGVTGAGVGAIAAFLLAVGILRRALEDPLAYGFGLSMLAIFVHTNLDFPAQNYSAALMMVCIPTIAWRGQG